MELAMDLLGRTDSSQQRKTKESGQAEIVLGELARQAGDT
jgi:hypothetical protein